MDHLYNIEKYQNITDECTQAELVSFLNLLKTLLEPTYRHSARAVGVTLRSTKSPAKYL